MAEPLDDSPKPPVPPEPAVPPQPPIDSPKADQPPLPVDPRLMRPADRAKAVPPPDALPVDPRLMRPADRAKAVPPPAAVPPAAVPPAAVPPAAVPPANTAPPAPAPAAAPAPVDPRLMRPADRAKAAPPAEAPKNPRPSIGTLFEQSIIALLDAPGVFFRLDQSQTPGPGASFFLALSWGAAFFAMNLIHLAISNPKLLQAYPQWQIGTVGGVGLVVWSVLYLLGSSFMYALGRMLGSGDFDRALLVAAITLTAAPLQALCSWFPTAWVAPSIIAGWIAACGLNTMFKANAWTARAVCTVLAAGALALQYGAGMLVEKYSAAAQLAAVAVQVAPSASELLDLQKQIQEVQAAAADLGNVSSQPPQSGQSSLDLLRGPAGEQNAQPKEMSHKQNLEQSRMKSDALNNKALGMLDSLAPMLNNPALTKNMNPQQKADLDELNREIKDIKAGLASGKPVTPEERRARTRKVQQLMMRMMSSGAAMPAMPTMPPDDAPKAAQP